MNEISRRNLKARAGNQAKTNAGRPSDARAPRTQKQKLVDPIPSSFILGEGLSSSARVCPLPSTTFPKVINLIIVIIVINLSQSESTSVHLASIKHYRTPSATSAPDFVALEDVFSSPDPFQTSIGNFKSQPRIGNSIGPDLPNRHPLQMVSSIFLPFKVFQPAKVLGVTSTSLRDVFN